ncbi:SDR family oxidoreductase [Segeticoccus rhizosphaerae]|jgi:uncharacterized protein YbjT (DUF2867 family)|uniref:SDR family oxidoreductase n=1 Tax=Segeticoccus rhizosphaerae TaxID=1104777 RepID=UPI0010BFB7B5|nr:MULTISPECIES: SDR family oxidoreductase [Intrasporangiaceae]
MTSPILLTGGTGTLGRLVIPRLREAGAEVRVLSRRSHPSEEGVQFYVGDLDTGEGVAAATDGVDAIVHCAGSQVGDDDRTRVLVREAARSGSPHLVYISVVGADRIEVVSRFDRRAFGYFASKRAAERVVEESGMPWTTLRATQFHDLMLTVSAALAKSPVIPLPRGRFQPVDAGEVATRLVELAFGEPSGLVPDLAGPRVYDVAELLRSYLRATHRRRLILPVKLPGRAARSFTQGGNLAPDRAVGHRTWEDFLAENV